MRAGAGAASWAADFSAFRSSAAGCSWGSIMVAFNIVAVIVEFVPTERALTLDTWLTIIGLGLCVFFGMKANQMAIERYRDLGWVFADPRRNLL